MSFDDITGAPVIRASEDPFEELAEFVNAELASGDADSDGSGPGKVERARIADIALAVGLNEDERRTRSGGGEVQFNLDSLDRDGVMKVMIEEQHPNQPGDHLRDILGEYLEGGVQLIGEQLDETTFQYDEYITESDIREE